jgi:hypothetical protein
MIFFFSGLRERLMALHDVPKPYIVMSVIIDPLPSTNTTAL